MNYESPLEQYSIPINVFVRYLFLFALALNLFNKFYYLFILSLLIVSDLQFSLKRHISIRFFVLLLFSTSYWIALISYRAFDIRDLIAVFSCPIAFLIGASCICKNNQWVRYIYAIVLGLACHGFLNFIYNYGSLADSQRAPIDCWLQTEWVITGQISLFILLSGFSYYVFFIMRIRKSPILKSLFILLWIVGIQYNVLCATRTVVYSVALNILFSVALSIFVLKEHIPKNVLIILSVSLFAVLVYYFNFFGIRNYIESTALFERISLISQKGSSHDIYSRQGQIEQAFKQLLDYPFGGYRMVFPVKIEFIHNAYLNIAYGEGLIPAVLFLTYTILFLKNGLDYLKQNTNSQFVFVTSGLYLATLTYFLIEPVFEANTSFVTLFCFIDGLVCNQLAPKRGEAMVKKKNKQELGFSL